MSRRLHSLFVYGSLRPGQPAHGLVNSVVRESEPATVRGAVRTVQDLDALFDGNEEVHGNLLRFDPEVMDQVLAIVDSYEGFVPGHPDRSLYVRQVVTAFLQTGIEEEAYAYFFNWPVS